jgi:hypothetical protein
VLFVCERLHEFYATGDISTVIHSGGVYVKWLNEADRVINLAPFTGNLSAHNTSYFSYIADLRDLIEQGEAFVKYLSAETGVDPTLFKRKLNTLQLLSNTEITKRAASRERMAPMGVLVHGYSSIAKSNFTKILFTYYGLLFDLDVDDEFRYVRNCLEPHWSNFNSSKWCIQLDDIAFMLPSKTNEVDPTTAEVIMIGNNVPIVPPQAALEDKGKTPVLSELLLTTSNCASLNAQEFFWCPLAVRRRLPFVIHLKPKDEFLHDNRHFIDPKKILHEEGCFPDLWVITVQKVVPRMQFDREMADLEDVQVFHNMNQFLQFFGAACKEHKANQERAMHADKAMKKLSVCKDCLLPLPHDVCISVQAGDSYVWCFIVTVVVGIISTICTNYAMVWWALRKVSHKPLFTRISFAIAERLGDKKQLVQLYGALIEARRSKPLINLCRALGILSLGLTAYFGYLNVAKASREVKRRASVTDDDVKEEKEKVSIYANQCPHEGGCNFETCPLDSCCPQSNKPHAKGKCPHGKPCEFTVCPLRACCPNKFVVQGNLYGTSEEQLLKETSSNVWYNPTVELTTFDVPLASASLANTTDTQVNRIFARNCVYLEIRMHGTNNKRTMRAVFLKGHICVTNAHAFKERGPGVSYTVTIVKSNMCEGVVSNISMDITTSSISFSEDSDICVFQADCLPPFKDISKFWQKTNLTPSSCVELIRQTNGRVETRPVFGLTYMANFPVESMPCPGYNIYYGHCSEPTENGHCGSLCVAITPRGPIIIGYHYLGSDRTVGILSVTLTEINNLILGLANKSRPVVQAGYEPPLKCATREHTLGPLHHKSIVRYLESGVVDVYGSFTGFRPKPKSKVCATPFQAEILQHYGTEVAYGKPAMIGWGPWRKNIVEMVKPNVTHDSEILHECVLSFSKDIISTLPAEWEKDVVILSDLAAVNGLPGVKYIDGINRNTSMGFPWNKSKSAFLIPFVNESYPDGVTFDQEFWDRVYAMIDNYKVGLRNNVIFNGQLKDEARPHAKCESQSTRLFASAPADWNIVVRKYLLSFVRLVQKNKYVFEAGPGTVCQSAEWGTIYNYLCHFGKNQVVAGDYGKYDKRMISCFILAAFDVILIVLQTAGFSEEELLIIMGIGTDVAFPFYNMNGDLLACYGSNPSGHPLTVVINSLVNSLYVRYTYRMLNPEREVFSFKLNVHLFTYGDDNVFGVSTDIPWFNHTTIQAVLRTIGVEYTMADKTSASVPYINIDDVSFLKRKWLYNSEVQDFLCPLEEESIIKSLTVWVPSGTVDKYKQMVDVITSANSEYFFYGREIFDVKHKFFTELCSQHPYSCYASKLPSFDELAERWYRASGLDHKIVVSDAEIGQSPNLKINLSCKFLDEEVTRGCDNSVEEIATSISLHAEGCDLPHGSNNSLIVQSADTEEVTTDQTELTSEVLTFVDASAGLIDHIEYVPSTIATASSTLNTSLEKFLSRPTVIDSRTWTTGTGVGVIGTVVKPWFAFMNNTVIKNKLQNYAFIRAKLCVKFIINGTPFHFGKVRVAYEPSVGFRESKVRTNPVSSTQLLLPYSQLPGTWLTPADNSGGEIHIPFFYHGDWIPLNNPALLQSLGQLTYFVAYPLKVASATGSTSITIDTFAWLEDVELNGSTSRLAVQAKDEYDGPISAPASAIAGAMRGLGSVPVIGKFARATEIGANALAGMAAIFGFTNTPIIDGVHAVVPLGAPHLASSEISTPIQKLTLDPKQELSVDPSMHGISSKDEMIISNIVSKSSILTILDWSTTEAVDTVKFNTRVNPGLFDLASIVNGSSVEKSVRIYHTPMSYLGFAFTHWRGDIVFDIEIVCTKFHKGRLKVSWDPVLDTGNVALDENQVYTTIIDIGQTTKASLRVPYHQGLAFLQTRKGLIRNWSTGTSLGSELTADNGMLLVSILTPLMSPVTPQSVGIMISVRAADNFEFANPRDNLGAGITASPPSFFAVQAKDEVEMQTQTLTLGDQGTSHPERYKQNMGEAVLSLRSLLHRYSLYDISYPAGSTSTVCGFYGKSYSRLPPMFGYDPLGLSFASKILAASGSAKFNFTPTHPLTYFSMLYGGYKGGVNFVANVSNDLYPYVGDIRVMRRTEGTVSGDRRGRWTGGLSLTSSSWQGQRAFNQLDTGTAGSAMTNGLTNGTISWNQPMELPTNFCYPDATTAISGNFSDQTDQECSYMSALIKQNTSSTSTVGLTFTSHAAAGVDYTLLWLLCCPTLDYYIDYPASAAS